MAIYMWREEETAPGIYYSDENRNEYQQLVNDTGSVQFVDSGLRFRFNSGVYIGNRTALDFNADSSTMRTVNLDTLTSTSKTLSVTMPNQQLKIWYWGDNRILTPRGVLDFEGNVITAFSYDSITPGDTGVVRANSGYDIYKGIVDGDDITFTKVGTGANDQFVGPMSYGRLGAYLINNSDTTNSGNSSYVNPSTNTITNFSGGDKSRQASAASGADGKLYRIAVRNNGYGKLQKIGTGDEGFVGDTLSTAWLNWGTRFGKFLGNIVSGGMNAENGTGNGYGSNNYFIDTSGDLTLVQSNAFPYDSLIEAQCGFIDEKGYIYPRTWGGGSGVILKTDKTFTNLNRKNPYLWR